MAVIFQDAMTDTAGTDLVSHTPDTGTSWTGVEDTSGIRAIVIDSGGTQAIPDAGSNNNALSYTADATYDNAEYDVEADLTWNSASSSSGAPCLLLARRTDNDNRYGLRCTKTSVTDFYIYKEVATTVTELASADTDLFGTSAVTVKFEIRTATKKGYIDGVEKISTTDNALTSTGKACLAFGACFLSADDVSPNWTVDNFTVRTVSAGPTTQSITATASGVAIVNRLADFFRTFGAIAAGAATISRLATFFRVFGAIATGIADVIGAITGITLITFAAIAGGVATVVRKANFFRTLQYTSVGAQFDGSNDWLTRGADLTGNAGSNQFTGSFWFKRGAIGSTQVVARATGSAYLVRFLSSDIIELYAENGAGTAILQVGSSAITDTASWHHVAFSFDLSDATKRHLIVDGVSDLAVVAVYTNDTIDFTQTNHSIGAETAGVSKFNGCLADFWLDFGTYLDLSDRANLTLFRSPGATARALGDDGSRPTGTSPIIFFSGDVTSWHTNKGTGGGYTENGALTECADAPAASPSLAVGIAAISAVKAFFQTFAATAVGSATIAFLASFYRTISAVAATIVTANGRATFYRTFSAVVAAVPNVTRVAYFFRTFGAVAIGTALVSATQGIGAVAFAVTAAGVATISRVANFYRTFSISAVITTAMTAISSIVPPPWTGGAGLGMFPTAKKRWARRRPSWRRRGQ